MSIERTSARRTATRRRIVAASAAVAVCAIASAAQAQTGNGAQGPADAAVSAAPVVPDAFGKGSGNATPADTYDALYERYLASARAMSTSPNANSTGW